MSEAAQVRAVLDALVGAWRDEDSESTVAGLMGVSLYEPRHVLLELTSMIREASGMLADFPLAAVPWIEEAKAKTLLRAVVSGQDFTLVDVDSIEGVELIVDLVALAALLPELP